MVYIVYREKGDTWEPVRKCASAEEAIESARLANEEREGKGLNFPEYRPGIAEFWGDGDWQGI